MICVLLLWLKLDKYENAIPLFEKAGNSYKVAKAWTEAGEAFTQASECYQKTEQFYDAAGKLKEVTPFLSCQTYVFNILNMNPS